MSDFAKEILPVSLEQELKSSYLDYAMSVIVGRALPDVRDGLKPVHRRVLYAMHELGNDYNKAYKKSARIVGDVIGKYHPHGDTAVYDTIVRMAQPFSMRSVLVDGQGNFGSVDGDAPAAMRYTEIRMTKLAHALLADLEKDTVDFVQNYDGSEQMPTVLPTRTPNLLINGSSGIAVGLATNIPPHNPTEVVNACIALIENADATIDDLMQYIPGPDFPTAGIINGRGGIVQAYRTGRGRIYVRAKAEVEKHGEKEAIVIHELPYQVNKARLLEKIAELVKDKRIEGITAIRDESDKRGMRAVIEVRRSENAEVILNNLYSHTQMQTVFGINMVALDSGEPKLLNLKQILEAFIRHRREVVTRRTLFDLKKARARAHTLEGLTVALANIDEVIALIKGSKTPNEAKEKILARAWKPGTVVDLVKHAGDEKVSRPEWLADHYGLHGKEYRLSPEQAQAILELRLHRLTGLEQDKITEEYKGLLDLIASLIAILENPERLMQVIREELLEAQKQFGNERRTEIVDSKMDLTHEDLITEQDVVVTFSHQGYAKAQPLDIYQAQRRGGRGKAATKVKEEDFVDHLLIANTHDTILCFSNRGKVYWLKVYQIPQGGRNARGRPVINLLPLKKDERINAILPIKEYSDNHFVFMATESGTVKKTALSAFSRQRNSGIIALELADNDRLVGAALTHGENEVMLFSSPGKAIRFKEQDVRPMGRTARGVRGIKLKSTEKVVGLVVPLPGAKILTATSNGYGKRTPVDEYRITGRGGQGVISIQVTERNGEAVSAVQVVDNEELMLISDKGTLVRTRSEEVSIVGRNAQGVRLIKLASGEHLSGVRRIVESTEE